MIYFSSSRRDRFRPGEALLSENNKKQIHSGEKAVGCNSDKHKLRSQTVGTQNPVRSPLMESVTLDECLFSCL